MATARKKPTDHLPPKGAEVPDFYKLPGREYFKPLSEVSADAAFDAIEALEETGFKDKDSEAITTRDVRAIMKIVFTEEFITDLGKFRTEFYTAEHMSDAATLAVAFLGVLGKGQS